jgi:hypothetical protein
MPLDLFNFRSIKLFRRSHRSIFVFERRNDILSDSLSVLHCVLNEFLIKPVAFINLLHDGLALSEEDDLTTALRVVKVPRSFLYLASKDSRTI